MSNIDVVRALYKAIGEGDVPAVLGGMSPGIEWREAEGNPYMPSGEAWVGPDAIVENLFAKLVTEWEGFTVQPKEFSDAGSTVVVEGRYTGTFVSTGTAIDSQFCHVIGVQDGKMTSFQQYTDTGQFQAAMGV
jgi:ketosteroid isomerase-like protein